MRRGMTHRPVVAKRGESPRSYQRSTRMAMALNNMRDSGPNAQRRNGKRSDVSQAPISIENEQRGIIVTAQQTILDIKNFRSAFKSEDSDFSDIKDIAAEILESLKLSESDIDTLAKFQDVLKEKKIDLHFQRRPEFGSLTLFCDKTKHFEVLAEAIKQKLSNSIDNHLKKFLLSFASEAGNRDIKCVREYTAKTKQHESKLKERRTKYDTVLQEIKDALVPFVIGYLHLADEMNEKMDEVLSISIEMCDIMKKWSLDDRAYPAKLWDEIITSNMVRGKMLEDLKRAQRKRDDLAHTLNRRTMAKDKVAAKLEHTKKERNKSKSHKDVVYEKVLKLENELAGKKRELEETEHKFTNRKSNSPRYIEMLENRIETLKDQAVKVTESLGVSKKQLSRYDKTDSSYSDIAAALEKEIKNHERALESYRQRLKTTDEALALATSELRETEAKIAIAKKIREMKLTPTTLRKIYYQHLDPSKHDKLTAACQLVSKHIGNSWRTLYQELPFSPPRDADKKQTDVHTIYVSSLRRDQTLTEQAWASLQKWRVFHRRGNVEQLLISLKRIEKTKLARHVDKMLKEADDRRKPIGVS